MQKRSRRKASEIEKLRGKILKIVKREGRISLTNLVRHYGSSIGIRNTPSDKNLCKRQLDILAKTTNIVFGRNGRDLYAQWVGEEEPAIQEVGVPAELERPPAAAISMPVNEPAPPPAVPAQAEAETPVEAPAPPPMPDLSKAELKAIVAYARQVEAFAKTLQDQVATLVAMVNRAAGE